MTLPYKLKSERQKESTVSFTLPALCEIIRTVSYACTEFYQTRLAHNSYLPTLSESADNSTLQGTASQPDFNQGIVLKFR